MFDKFVRLVPVPILILPFVKLFPIPISDDTLDCIDIAPLLPSSTLFATPAFLKRKPLI